MKDKEVYFKQQVWARLVEMTESEGETQNGKCFHKKTDQNNLESKFLKQHCFF